MRWISVEDEGVIKDFIVDERKTPSMIFEDLYKLGLIKKVEFDLITSNEKRKVCRTDVSLEKLGIKEYEVLGRIRR